MISPKHIVELLRAEGSAVTVTEPGKVIEDADGVPAWVTEGEATAATLMPPILTGAEWEATARWLLGALEIYCPDINALIDFTKEK